MKVKVIGHFVVATMLFSASSAFALVDASLGIGQRNATFTNNGADTEVKGIDTVLSAHISPFPIPMVNIGLGAAVALTEWDKDQIADRGSLAGLKATEAKGLDVSLEAMVSLSIPFLATPYVKAGYSVLNTQGVTYKLEAAGASATEIVALEKGNGMTLGVGAKFSILPFISAMLEMSTYSGSLESDSLKVNGVKTDPTDKDTDFASMSYLIGVEVDIGL